MPAKRNPFNALNLKRNPLQTMENFATSEVAFGYLKCLIISEKKRETENFICTNIISSQLGNFCGANHDPLKVFKAF